MSEITRRGVAVAAASLFAAGPAAALPKLSLPKLPRMPKFGLGPLPPEPGPPLPVFPSPWHDATETANLIRAGQLSGRQVMESALDRATAMQPALNFIVTSDYERALTLSVLPPSGDFGGVPFLVKDLDDKLGLPTRMGSAARLTAPPAADSAVIVQVFERMGLRAIGKSATPEWGFLPTTEPTAFGATRNPWNPNHSAGGSSGGAAAAVAAGVVPIAHASDGGGSIRIPASCCGVFGLKPSRGKMLGQPREDRVTDLSVDHVLTRTVRDSAAAFALAENTASDAPFPPTGFIRGPNKRRLNIGLLLDSSTGEPPHPEVRAATERTAVLLRQLGHKVTPTRWPIGPSFTEDFLLLWASGAADLAAGLAKAAPGVPMSRMLEPFTIGMAEMFGRAPEGALDGAIERLKVASMAYSPWFAGSGFHVVLSPVLATPPPPLGYLAPTVPFRTLIERLIRYVGYTPYHNVAGAPAMSVPLHWSSDGLPIGAQFAARPGHEVFLFELAYELEQAQPWAAKLPPVRADRTMLPMRFRDPV
jgi:amidase